MKIQINKDWIRKLTEEYPFLHNIFKWHDGFDFTATEQDEQRIDKHILGADVGPTPVILQPNRDWSEYWPADEKQSGSIESMGCTLFGLFNVIEALAKKQFNEVWDKSEHFNAGLIPISRNGGTPSNALDSVRKNHGMINESIYPNNIDSTTWNEWVQYPDNELIQKGKYFLSKYEVYFKEIPNTTAGILNGLQYSPIYCAGSSWAKNNKGLYYSFGNPNHAFTIKKAVGYRLFAGDSYDPFEKELDPSYKIYWPKIIILRKKTINENIMTNSKLVKREIDGKLQLGIFDPSDSEEALRSACKNRAIALPLDDNGNIKWNELKEAGEVKLYTNN